MLAIAYAILRRPNARSAAVAIDEKLKLKEKISTALFVRGNTANDPFAAAALRDAEQTAQNVAINFRQHFPMKFPRAAWGSVSIAVIALCTALFMAPLDLFGRTAYQKKQAAVEAQREQARQSILKTLTVVQGAAKAAPQDEAIRNARIEMEHLLDHPIKDPAQAQRSAMKALQDVREALKKEAQENAKYAEAQNQMKLAKSLMPAADDKTPVAQIQREMAQGNFTDATNELEKLVQNFDKLDAKQQQQLQQQMQKLAQQLQQQAGDPKKQQQQIQQQLQNMGVNQQLAQQMAQQLQQAAQGDKQAQQQLQQLQQQAMQQLKQQAQAGNQQAQQQLQQMQQMMQKLQAQANSQQGAQQMAQAAQQMAQAMQQGAQGQPNQPQQGQNGQQAANQQMQQAMQ
jgi:hypothetical protein